MVVGWLMALVVVLTVLCLGNLLLTFAVVRRLRVHEEKMAAIAFPESDLDTLVGRRLPELAVGDGDGDGSVSPAVTVADERLVGLFSAGCRACVEQARQFQRHPDPDRVAVVVLGAADADMAEELLVALDGAPAIVSEPASSRIADELGVSAFPVLLRVDESDVVVRAGHALASLIAPTAATR